MHDATNYFASDVTTNPYLHTWSLAVEEQFYLFWPALIMLSLSRVGSRRRLATVFLAMCVISLALCVWLTDTRQPWAFFSLPTRAWEFSLGGLACLVHKTDLAARAGWMKWLGWAGLAAILTAGCLYSPTTSFPGYAAMLPIAGTVATLLAGASGVPSSLQSLLASRVLQYLGRLSLLMVSLALADCAVRHCVLSRYHMARTATIGGHRAFACPTHFLALGNAGPLQYFSCGTSRAVAQPGPGRSPFRHRCIAIGGRQGIPFLGIRPAAALVGSGE